jgi:hypothetical protein
MSNIDNDNLEQNNSNTNPNKTQSGFNLLLVIIISLFVGGAFVYFLQQQNSSNTTPPRTPKQAALDYIAAGEKAKEKNESVEKEKYKLNAAMDILNEIRAFNNKAKEGVTQSEIEQMRIRYNSFVNEMAYPEHYKWSTNDLSDFNRKASNLVDYIMSQKR